MYAELAMIENCQGDYAATPADAAWIPDQRVLFNEDMAFNGINS
jgi:hypothetical protein